MVFVGVDACRSGWVAICLPHEIGAVRGVFAPTLEALASQVPDARGFGVDIPMGLPVEGRRAADVEARRFVGPRRNSVFLTPVRAAVEAPRHAEATEVALRRSGHGISQQAYALAAKILEAERWRREVGVPVWEVHPEVSFTLLLGHPARSPKKTWSGMWERLEGLRAAGIDLSRVGLAGQRAAADDVLDAAVAAWSARRLVRGQGVSIPDPPATDPMTGEPVAIWA